MYEPECVIRETWKVQRLTHRIREEAYNVSGDSYQPLLHALVYSPQPLALREEAEEFGK
jgi:hypothetical protein